MKYRLVIEECDPDSRESWGWLLEQQRDEDHIDWNRVFNDRSYIECGRAKTEQLAEQKGRKLLEYYRTRDIEKKQKEARRAASRRIIE